MNITTKIIDKKPGIYFIKNINNNKVYIGQSVNCYKRLIFHRHQLRHGTHDNPHLQRSFNKHGEDKFKCGVIEYSDDNLTVKEIFYINHQNNNEVYNIKDACNAVKYGVRAPITEETRYKLHIAKKGIRPSNLEWLQRSNMRIIMYYINNVLQKQFKSCKEAANYFGMASNTFHQYIGKPRNTKKFPKGYKIVYGESRERRYNIE